jgi:CubicO group peptidase (beta-lactamase class C family)
MTFKPKKVLKVFFIITLLVLLIHGALHLSGKTFIYKALIYNYVNIDDLDLFEKRLIPAGQSQPWAISSNYNSQRLSPFADSIHKTLRSVAYLVIKDDSLMFEEYWDGYSDTSYSNSFSMAKSIVSMLIGVAITDGFIKSVEEPVANYLPEFNEQEKSNIKIKHLLRMSSGLSWDESYSSPFSMTTEAYYGTDLYKLVMNQSVVSPSGQKYSYLSGDTQLLAFLVEKASGKSISEYLSERVWKPIGANRPAFWSLDRTNGMEKAYCCVYSNARDFARIGKLYMDHGAWNGLKIIDSSYVSESLTASLYPDEYGNPTDYYGYQWWILPEYKGRKIFYARGILGQYVFVSPLDRLIVVRLGHLRTKDKREGQPADIWWYLDEGFSLAALD